MRTSGGETLADRRRVTVAEGAVKAFARTGYHGTTVAAVAEEVGISPAYVFKLFPGKPALFVAALEACYRRIMSTLDDAAEKAAGGEPPEILDAMGAAYADLIGDRDLLALQVHALSVGDVAEVRAAIADGMRQVVQLASDRSGASADDVQQFIARGQLCHLIVMLNLEDDDTSWASILSHGFRHPAKTGKTGRKGGVATR